MEILPILPLFGVAFGCPQLGNFFTSYQHVSCTMGINWCTYHSLPATPGQCQPFSDSDLSCVRQFTSTYSINSCNATAYTSQG